MIDTKTLLIIFFRSNISLMKSSQTLFLTFCLLVSVCSSFDALINPSATAETKELYQALISNYDKYVISGQTTFNYDEFVSKTGLIPMLRGFDMQNYSPHNPWHQWTPYDDGTVDKAIKWYHD